MSVCVRVCIYKMIHSDSWPIFLVLVEFKIQFLFMQCTQINFQYKTLFTTKYLLILQNYFIKFFDTSIFYLQINFHCTEKPNSFGQLFIHFCIKSHIFISNSNNAQYFFEKYYVLTSNILFATPNLLRCKIKHFFPIPFIF